MVKISQPSLKTPPSCKTIPVLLIFGGFYLIFKYYSLPKKSVWMFPFLIVHYNKLSTGEMSSLISWPCKHKPASNLKVSQAPNPAGFNNGFSKSYSQKCSTTIFGTEISNPSSPVYPVL